MHMSTTVFRSTADLLQLIRFYGGVKIERTENLEQLLLKINVY